MLNALLNIFKIPELRHKVLVTLGLLAVYRIGAHIPTPFIDPSQMESYFENTFGSGGIFGVVDMFSGGAFGQMTVFALGIMPYISASIIIQLLAAVWPRLEKIRREGEAGQRKITQWTRYGTVILSLFQGLGIAVWLFGEQLSMIDNRFLFYVVTTITMCTGTCFLMWLGERITQRGIGNGISLIIALGIMAQYPTSIASAFYLVKNDSLAPIKVVAVFVLLIFVAALIVINQLANRKIPVQHARRMVGRKMMQGGNTNIPLKLNTAGVIPVIFSSAILTFPMFLFNFLGQGPGTIGHRLTEMVQMNSSYNLYTMLGLNDLGGIFLLLKVVNVYTILYIILTAFFCFFYTAITLNPVELADNLKKQGAFVPGIKPGKHTADFVDHILVRITVVGAAILILVALIPEVLYVGFGIPFGIAQIAGGTGLIIVVGVFLDTMKQIESQLLMRHYQGFTVGAAGGSTGGTTRTRRQTVNLRRSSTK